MDTDEPIGGDRSSEDVGPESRPTPPGRDPVDVAWERQLHDMRTRLAGAVGEFAPPRNVDEAKLYARAPYVDSVMRMLVGVLAERRRQLAYRIRLGTLEAPEVERLGPDGSGASNVGRRR